MKKGKLNKVVILLRTFFNQFTINDKYFVQIFNYSLNIYTYILKTLELIKNINEFFYLNFIKNSV